MRIMIGLIGLLTAFSNPERLSASEVRLHPTSEEGRQRASYRAAGKNGVVVTAHPLASKIGLAALQRGGTAADALIAASFAISVLRPQSTGLGGGGFLLYYDSDQAKTVVLDFRERAPSAAHRDMYVDKQGKPIDTTYRGAKIPNASVNGHLAAGVPGLVAGLGEVHRRFAKLSFASLAEPAAKLAEEGFAVYNSLARTLISRATILQHFEGSKAIFLPKGSPLALGDKLVQKDLAKTIRRLAKHGVKDFYTGELAKLIIAEMKRGGGLITAKDLASYRVKERPAVSASFKGYRIVSMPPPSSGGTHIAQILNMLAGDDFSAWRPDGGPYLHTLAEAMKRAFADRARFMGDPDFVKIPLQRLLSMKYAQQQRASISKTATPAAAIQAGKPATTESDSTTHISVVDRFGNAASSTQTINYGFGSCVVVQGTGIVLNDEMDDFSKRPGVPNAYGLVGGEANAIEPGKTMLSSMSPTLVFDAKKHLKMMVGSPGGPRIITATLQTILNHLAFGLPLLEAVHAHRIHHQWQPDVIRIEPHGLSPQATKLLKKRGHRLEARGHIGDVQAIARHGEGWVGVSDARSEGKPAAY